MKSSRSVPAAAVRGPDGAGGGGGQAIVEVTAVICTSAGESTRNRRNTTLKSHAHTAMIRHLGLAIRGRRG